MKIIAGVDEVGRGDASNQVGRAILRVAHHRGKEAVSERVSNGAGEDRARGEENGGEEGSRGV